MFERFTQDARRVVELAHEEALGLGHDWLGTEHILLALIDGEHVGSRVLASLGVDRHDLLAEYRGIVGHCEDPLGPFDPEALATLGIDVDEVRRALEEAFGPGALEGTSTWRRRRRLRLTDRSKRALEASLTEAVALGHRHLGPEHILLGLGKVTDGLAARLLARRRASLPVLRAAVVAELRRSA